MALPERQIRYREAFEAYQQAVDRSNRCPQLWMIICLCVVPDRSPGQFESAIKISLLGERYHEYRLEDFISSNEHGIGPPECAFSVKDCDLTMGLSPV